MKISILVIWHTCVRMIFVIIYLIFFYSKSVSEYDTQSKKFFIDQNFETSLEMKKNQTFGIDLKMTHQLKNEYI